MSKFLLLAALCASVTPASVRTDQVDVIELHRFYDSDGKLVFSQLIFWIWNGYDSRHDVAAWRILKDADPLPRRAPGGFFQAIWRGSEGISRVKAKIFRRSHLQSDPEVTQRKVLPRDERRGVFGAKPGARGPHDVAR